MSATSVALRAAQRREPVVALPQRVLNAAIALLAVLGFGYAVLALRPLVDLPVTRVDVAGRLTHLTPAAIAAAAAVVPGTHLFELPMRALHARVAALPWIANVEVTRRWPDSVTVAVTERTAVARWGDHGLVDADGTAFTPAAQDLSDAQRQALPQLDGAPDQAAAVLDAWKTLAPALQNTPFALTGLGQDARGDWTAQCRSGVTLRLGNGDPADKLALIRDTVLPALADKLPQVAAVDLRYTNGFAVRWADAQSCAGGACKRAAALSTPMPEHG